MYSQRNNRGGGMTAKQLLKSLDVSTNYQVDQEIKTQSLSQRQNIAQRKRKSDETEEERLTDIKFKKNKAKVKEALPEKIMSRKGKAEELEVNLEEVKRLTAKLKKRNLESLRGTYELKQRKAEAEEFLLERARERELEKKTKEIRKRQKKEADDQMGEGKVAQGSILKEVNEKKMLKALEEQRKEE